MTLTSTERNVLTRVSNRKPLNRDDQADAVNLITRGLLTVTPTYDRKDTCPYALLPAGQAALKETP
jgi:hypothetical protein